MQVLWPEPGTVPREPPDTGTAINNVSVVLLGEVGRRRFLLAGDVEEGVDPALLERSLPHVDLLKVAHHGSRDRVHPGVRRRRHDHGSRSPRPAPATVRPPGSRDARAPAAVGARTLRTDQDGSVAIELADRA